MKALVIALIMPSTFAYSETSKNPNSDIPVSGYLSIQSAERLCQRNQLIECGIKEKMAALYDEMTRHSAPVAEYEIIKTKNILNQCRIYITTSFRLDVSAVEVQDYKKMIGTSFSKVLEALKLNNRATVFSINKDSFLYDSRTKTFLFTHLQNVIHSSNGELEDKHFVQKMTDRLNILFHEIKISDFLLDFAIDTFNLQHEGFKNESLFENINLKSEDSDNAKEDFHDNFDINVIRGHDFLWVKTRLNDSPRDYKFSKDGDMISIYLCQNKDNKGESECMNLIENQENQEAKRKIRVRKNLRLEVSYKKVSSLDKFLKKSYYKIFLTFMDKNARGIITTNSLRESDNNLKKLLNKYFIIRDDGLDEIKISEKNSSESIQTLKLKKFPLDIVNNIDVYRVFESDVKNSMKKNISKYTRFYEIKSPIRNTLIASDEQQNAPAKLFYYDKLIDEIGLIKICTDPFPNISGFFQDGAYKLIFNNEEKIYPKFAYLYEPNNNKDCLFRCIELNDKNGYSIKYDRGKETKQYFFRWNFNSQSEKDKNGIQANKVLLSDEQKSVTPGFDFATFEFPKLKDKVIFLSISNTRNKDEYLIQGIFFKTTTDEGITIHHKNIPMIFTKVPRIIHFNKDYSINFSEKILDAVGLISQSVSYLTDDEIVYHIENLCSSNLTPNLELSKNNESIIINCVYSGDGVSLTESGGLDTKMKSGLQSVADQIKLNQRRIV